MERKFKDSGIDWIQKIPETWEVGQLKRLLSFNNGQDYKHIESDSGYPVYGSGGVFMHASQYLYDGEAVLFGRKGTINKPLYVNDKFWTVDTMYYALPKEDCIAKYIYYMAILFPYDKYQTSTALPSMTQSILGNLIVCIPQKDEQQRIADYLDEKCREIDSLIGLQEQMIEALKAYKQSVITEAVTRGLAPNAKLVPSGIDWIGEIPEGVNLVKLSMLTSKIGSGSTPRGGSSIYVKEGIKFLRSQNVYCEGFDLSDVAYITEDIDEEMSGTRVQVGDVLLNITGGSIGRCYFVDETLGRANVNQHVSIIRPTKIETKYLKYYLQSECGQMQIALLQTGGNREGLSAAALSQFIIVYPSVDEQKDIAVYLDEKCLDIDCLIEMKQKKIEKLKDYKKSIIYEAVTGKIDNI